MTCSGLTRWKLESALENGKPITCRMCKGEKPRKANPFNEGIIPGRCRSGKCSRKKIRKKDDFVVCQKCNKQYHTQEKCCEMTRKQLEILKREQWECPGCIDKVPAPIGETGDPAESNYAKANTGTRILKILQLNVNQLLSKIETLREFLKKNEVDIFCLQETKLIKKKHTPRFIDFKGKPYNIIRKDRAQPKGCEMNRGGGLIIGISQELAFKHTDIEIRGATDNMTEWLTVEIPTKDNNKIRITNIYVRPDRKNTAGARMNPEEGQNESNGEEEAQEGENGNTDQGGTRRVKLFKRGFDVRRWPCREYDIILGDANAHSVAWDNNPPNGKADKRGTILENWMAAKDMCTINDGTRTHIDYSTKKREKTGTAPDITFVHPTLLDRMTWEVVNDLGSDHLPIMITYMDDIPTVNNKPTYKWRIKDADWESFRQTVEKGIPNNYGQKNVDKVEKALRKAILKGGNQHVRKRKITQKNKSCLTTEIKELCKKRNKLRKTVSNNREEFIQVGREIAKKTKEERAKRWKEYVNELNRKSDSREIFKTIRSLDGRTQTQNRSEVLEVDGVSYIEDADKAKEFAKTYQSFSRLPRHKSDRAMRKNIWKHMKTMKNRTDLEESEGEITMEEMERVINETNNNRAAGQDDIPYEFLQHLGPRAKEMLLYLYRKCWRGEGYPTMWRTASIKPLLKEGKDSKKTASYRPISLTSCMGKVLEKIIADRLVFVLETRNLLSHNQAGFRQGRCTTDQIIRLVQAASNQVQSRKTSNRTITTFFDYEKAYDKVWRVGLLTKMVTLNIPPRFIQYVRNFLSGRKTVVEVNNVNSETFILKEGLPQGSSISPLLFLIFINDIDVDLNLDTAASLFADDTAIWKEEGKEKGSGVALMQEEVDKIMEWAKKWKMSVNADKTRSMVISESKTAEQDQMWKPEITADGETIETVDEYKFLGVTISNDLRFKSHIDNTVAKSKKRVNVIKCMSTKDWGNSLETQRTIYKQYVRSAMEYASPSFNKWTAKTNIQRLQRIQNEALRSVGQLAKTCPQDYLHLETGIEPLEDRFQKNDQLLWERYDRMPDDDPRKRMLGVEVPPRLKTRHGWKSTTQPGMTDPVYQHHSDIPSIPPWRGVELVFDSVVLEKKKEEYSKEDLRRMAEEKIDSMDAEVLIYTDGSTSGKQENGGAGLYVEDSRTGETWSRSYPAGKISSSYGAEGVAMLEAMRWIRQNECSAVIITDSMSLQTALRNNNWKDKCEILAKIKEEAHLVNNKPTILWIPSHCDVKGNEEADKMAELGSRMDQSEVPVAHAMVKARIKSKKWTVTHRRAAEMYGDRRSPMFAVEREWPRDARRLFSRLRTGHTQELKDWSYKIDEADDPACECGHEKETTEHLLCECPMLDGARRRYSEGRKVSMEHMITEPEMCRRILLTRFPELTREDNRKKQTTSGAGEAEGQPTNGAGSGKRQRASGTGNAGKQRASGTGTVKRKARRGAGDTRRQPTRGTGGRKGKRARGTGDAKKQQASGKGGAERQSTSGTGVAKRKSASGAGDARKQAASGDGDAEKQPASGARVAKKKPRTGTGEAEKQSGRRGGDARKQPTRGTGDAEKQPTSGEGDRQLASGARKVGRQTTSGVGIAKKKPASGTRDAERQTASGTEEAEKQLTSGVRAAGKGPTSAGGDAEKQAASGVGDTEKQPTSGAGGSKKKSKRGTGDAKKQPANGEDDVGIQPISGGVMVLSTRLSNVERRFITSGEELDDNVATKAMRMIMQQVPQLDIQATSLSSIPEQLQYHRDATIFIHHTERQHHFVMSTSIGGVIRTYDSLNLDPSTMLKRQIAALYRPSDDSSHVDTRRIQHMFVEHKQRGSLDCGVFAIAYAVEAALGTDPEEISKIRFNQRAMRPHLEAAFDSGQLTRFPREEEVRRSSRAAGLEKPRPRKKPKKNTRGMHDATRPPAAPDQTSF